MNHKPYTYLIGWSTQNRWYYGVRYAKDCNPNDLWTSYFTSSRHVKAFRKDFGEPDVIQIRNVFTDKSKATRWEQKVLFRMKVSKDPKFLNKTSSHAIEMTDELKQILSEAQKLQWSDPAYRKRMSDGRKGKDTWNKGKTGYKNGPCTDARANSISEARLMTKKLECPWCLKQCDPGNAKIWHFDKCKKNPESAEYWAAISLQRKIQYQNLRA